MPQVYSRQVRGAEGAHMLAPSGFPLNMSQGSSFAPAPPTLHGQRF